MPAPLPDDRARVWARRSLTLYAVAFALPVGDPSFPGAQAFAASFMQGVSGQPFFMVIWLANPLLWLAVGLEHRQRTGWATTSSVLATLAALVALRMVGDDLYSISPLPWRAAAIRSGLFAWIGGIAGFTLATARLWWLGREGGRPIQVRLGWMMTAVALAALAIQVWRWAEPPKHPPIRCNRGRDASSLFLVRGAADPRAKHRPGPHHVDNPQSDRASG